MIIDNIGEWSSSHAVAVLCGYRSADSLWEIQDKAYEKSKM
jgi:hypothetical protein